MIVTSGLQFMMTKKSPAKTEVRDRFVMAVVASPRSNMSFVSVLSPLAGAMLTAGTALLSIS